jgi:hypothetical protein
VTNRDSRATPDENRAVLARRHIRTSQGATPPVPFPGISTMAHRTAHTVPAKPLPSTKITAEDCHSDDGHRLIIIITRAHLTTQHEHVEVWPCEHRGELASDQCHNPSFTTLGHNRCQKPANVLP